jgi:hypothetical protein
VPHVVAPSRSLLRVRRIDHRTALATVDLLGVVCLILFFVVGGPFGSINDVANAAVGVLSAVLAYPIWCFRLARTQRLGDDVRLSTEKVEPNRAPLGCSHRGLERPGVSQAAWFP